MFNFDFSVHALCGGPPKTATDRQHRFDRKMSKLKMLWKQRHLHLGCPWGKLKYIKNDYKVNYPFKVRETFIHFSVKQRFRIDKSQIHDYYCIWQNVPTENGVCKLQ